MSNQYFQGSCVPVDRANCTAGQDLIDPCSCTKYFECVVQYDVINRTCSLGTAYNHNSEICTNAEDIYFKGICNQNQPWTRCQGQGADLAALAARCTGSTVTSSTPLNTSPILTTTQQTTQSSPDVGIIIGAIFGALFLVVVLILIIVMWKRQKTLEKKKLESRPSLQNPEYFVDTIEKIDEDPYNMIDEEMNSPVYNNNTTSTKGPSLPYRPSASGTMTSNDGTLNSNGDITKHNTNTLSSEESEYVEPNDTGTVRINTSLQSDVLRLDNGNGANYVECLPSNESESKEDTLNLEPTDTPYDNSWLGRK